MFTSRSEWKEVKKVLKYAPTLSKQIEERFPEEHQTLAALGEYLTLSRLDKKVLKGKEMALIAPPKKVYAIDEDPLTAAEKAAEKEDQIERAFQARKEVERIKAFQLESYRSGLCQLRSSGGSIKNFSNVKEPSNIPVGVLLPKEIEPGTTAAFPVSKLAMKLGVANLVSCETFDRLPIAKSLEILSVSPKVRKVEQQLSKSEMIAAVSEVEYDVSGNVCNGIEYAVKLASERLKLSEGLAEILVKKEVNEINGSIRTY